MLIVGIDPGLEGAIAFLDYTGIVTRLCDVVDMPLLNLSRGRKALRSAAGGKPVCIDRSLIFGRRQSGQTGTGARHTVFADPEHHRSPRRSGHRSCQICDKFYSIVSNLNTSNWK